MISKRSGYFSVYEKNPIWCFNSSLGASTNCSDFHFLHIETLGRVYRVSCIYCYLQQAAFYSTCDCTYIRIRILDVQTMELYIFLLYDCIQNDNFSLKKSNQNLPPTEWFRLILSPVEKWWLNK